MYLSIYLSTYLSIYIIYLSTIYLPISVYRSISLSLSLCLSVGLSVYLSVCLPYLPTCLMKIRLALCLTRDMHLPKSSSNIPTLALVFDNAAKPKRLAHLWQGAESIAPKMTSRRPKAERGVWFNMLPSKFTFSTSQLPKVVRTCF